MSVLAATNPAHTPFVIIGSAIIGLMGFTYAAKLTRDRWRELRLSHHWLDYLIALGKCAGIALVLIASIGGMLPLIHALSH